MKYNIYETDRFFHYIDLDDNKGYLGNDFCDDLFEIPESLVNEYKETLIKFEEINRKLREIKNKR